MINDLRRIVRTIVGNWVDSVEKLVTIRNLGPEQAMLAFPLAREAACDVTPDRWREMVNKLAGNGACQDHPGGIVVAERNGFPRGLFPYEATDVLAPGRQLLVRNLVVMEIVRRVDAASVLFDHMGELAEMFACGGVHVDLPPVSAWIQNHWGQLVRPELGVPFAYGD